MPSHWNVSDIERFFLKHGKAQAWANIRPLFEEQNVTHLQVHEEEYSFRRLPKAEVDVERFLLSFERLTGRRTEHVLLVSAAEPFPKPDWMPDRMYENQMRRPKDLLYHMLLDKGLRARVHPTLNTYLMPFQEKFEVDAYYVVSKVYQEDCDGPDTSVPAEDWEATKDALAALLDAAFFGDEALVRTLSEFLTTVSGLDCLGWLVDEPTTLIALCA